jgi:hypothetical protein
VLVPANPGILCAMGLLLTDLRADFALTRLLPAIEASTADVAEAFAALSQRADRWFEHETIAPSHRRLARTVDMRYHGQNYELSVAVPDGAITPVTMQALLSGFADVHRQRYGFAADGDPVQLVTLRVEATGTVRKAELLAHPDAGPDASAAIVHHRPVWLAETRDFTATSGSTPAIPAPGQPLRRPRHRRADGRDHPGATRHDRTGRRTQPHLEATMNDAHHNLSLSSSRAQGWASTRASHPRGDPAGSG